MLLTLLTSSLLIYREKLYSKSPSVSKYLRNIQRLISCKDHQNKFSDHPIIELIANIFNHEKGKCS